MRTCWLCEAVRGGELVTVAVSGCERDGEFEGTLVGVVGDARDAEGRGAGVEAEERRLPFVIVTARGITGTYPMLEQNDIACPVVTYSGGVILDRDRSVVYHHGFSKKTAQDVVEFIERRGFDLTWSAYAFEDWVSPRKDDERLRNEERIVMAEAREGDIASIAHDEVQKLLLICDPAQTVGIEGELRGRFPELAVMRSSNILIEVMPRGTNKARAVRTLCELWGADPAAARSRARSTTSFPSCCP